MTRPTSPQRLLLGLGLVLLVTFGLILLSSRTKRMPPPPPPPAEASDAGVQNGGQGAEAAGGRREELVALSRAHQANSEPALAAFTKIARANAAVGRDQLELIEGALLRADSEYFHDGFLSADRAGLSVEVKEEPEAFMVDVRSREFKVNASWGLRIDKQTGAVSNTWRASQPGVVVSLSLQDRRLKGALHSCYREALIQDGALEADGELGVTLDSAGKARRVVLDIKPRLPDAFARCVRDAVLGNSYESPDSGSVLRVRVAFLRN